MSEIRRYSVTGMSCAACSASVERAVSRVEGVQECQVNLLTQSMTVKGTAEDAAVILAVEKAGYGAKPNQEEKRGAKSPSLQKEERDGATTRLLRRLIASCLVLLVLMYFSMGHMLWNFPLPPFLHDNHVGMGLVQLLLCVVILYINRAFFISGVKSALHGAPNMDTLVSLGAGVAFLYSTYELFAMTAAQAVGDAATVEYYMMNLYFESAATILTLITVGKTLESFSKGKTTDALKSLIALAPPTATLLCGEEEKTVPVEEVTVGDVFTVRPGERVPVDGEVLFGGGAVDEAMLTGESVPVDKKEGDAVSAGTVNLSGYLRCRATRVGADTALSGIVRMVEEASASKAPIARIADKVSGVFVPVVLALALLFGVIWGVVTREAGVAIERAITILVISCPCALGLATPVAIMVGNGVGARRGILFKNATALETLSRVKTVLVDKTGTVTKGMPEATDIFAAVSEEELLKKAYSLERASEHPLAKAVVSYAQAAGTPFSEVKDFRAEAGNGLSGEIDEEKVYGGNAAFISRFVPLPQEACVRADEWAQEGKTPLFFAQDNRFLGVIAVADTVREDSPQAIADLKKMGIKTVMLTGDNERTAAAVARRSGVDEVIAGVLPDGKAEVVRRFREKGKVAMAGDGINDAPALTAADVGIAIGAGTDVAIDAADVVLTRSTLSDAVTAIRLSKKTLLNIVENLFWAFIYNLVCIPLAAAGVMQPMYGALAMSLSSFCVVVNALRLNLFGRRKKKEGKNPRKEDGMTVILKVKGMMCEHCENRVKTALEGVDGVRKAQVSHKKGEAVISLDKQVPADALIAVVKAHGYDAAL